MNVACSFGCATVPQTGIVDSSTDDIDTWDFGADVWESALSNKAKSASVFEIKNEGLDKLKKLLTNGYVASFITTIDYWTYRAAQYPSGDVVCTASIINESITNALGHTMTIVGYDDNVCVDLDDNGCITDDERGALKVVNSWSSSYLNDGYCWVLYSALINETELNDENQESVNEEANSEEAITKEAVVVDGLIYFIEPSVSYTPLLLAEVTLNTAKRNELSVDIGISSTDEETPSYTATVTDYIMRDRPNNNNNFESLSKGYSLAFKNYKIREGSFANFTIVSTYELSPSDATFRFDLTPVIQDYYDDHASLFGQESEVSDQTSLNYNQNPDLRFYVSISDSDYNNYPNILKNFQIKGSGSKVESEVNYTLPLTANGPPTQTAYVDFNIKPMLVSATNEFNIAFNQSVSPESIYDGVEVKTKTSENTYGSIVDAMKILGLNGTVLKIKPPYIGLSTGRKYVEHQHYSVVFFNYLKTPGGTPITPPKVFDFYIMQ